VSGYEPPELAACRLSHPVTPGWFELGPAEKFALLSGPPFTGTIWPDFSGNALRRVHNPPIEARAVAVNVLAEILRQSPRNSIRVFALSR